MPLVSIIIPVFNTERFLPRCLDSVLGQSFTDFELFLIDDGSTDNSGVICDAYAILDNRIRVFHKENGGVSTARNRGIESAQGEWLFFIDSDDELLPGGLQVLVSCISNDVDIVMGGFVEVDEDGNEITVDERVTLLLPKKQSVVTLYGGHGSYYPYCGYLWIRLLRNRVVQEHHLLFDSSIAIKEDTLFLMQFVCRSNGITIQTTTPVYKYYRRSDSAMGKVTGRFNSRYVDSFFALVKMKHEVEALFPSHSTPVFIAKQAIYGRYYVISDLMDACRIHDDALKNNLGLVMRHELGSIFLFKVGRKVRKVFNILG